MSLPRPERVRAARVWSFRWTVEDTAHLAFADLAQELAALGCPGALVEAAREASEDEKRHAGMCADLARTFGADERASVAMRTRLAPSSLSRDEALAYEIVARCCVAETESTATLVELMPRTHASVRGVVHAIAKDEVRHARLGWQYLAWAAKHQDLRFLGAHLPTMLEVGGGPLFDPAGPVEREDPSLGAFSVGTQRTIFVDVLDQVVFPGLALHGIAIDLASAWLGGQRRRFMQET